MLWVSLVWTFDFYLNLAHHTVIREFKVNVHLRSWAVSNQITVVALQPVQLTQASFLQKNQMLQNVF